MATFYFLFFFTHLIFLYPNTCNCKTSHKFKTILVFGDSTVDSGNNNYISTLIRCNHSPYGINFPGKIATGRFSDGKLPPDLIASSLGIKDFVPPFLDPNLSNNDLVTGVSFASSGAGYDDLTALETSAISLPKQAAYCRKYMEKLKSSLGGKEAMNIINNALVIVSAGVDDFVLNYYDWRTRKFQYTIQEYQDFVLNNLQKFVQELYNMGCRWIVIGGLPPIGCLPIQMTVKLKIFRRCIGYQNSDAQSYNQNLSKIIPQLQLSLQGSKLFYADIYTPLYNIITNPRAYGFTKTNRGCCGTGLLELGPTCSWLTPLCRNVSEYVFFDSIHPTESVYRYLSEALESQIRSQEFNITNLPS